MAAVDSFPLFYQQLARSLEPYRDAFALIGLFYATKKSISLVCDLTKGIKAYFWPLVSPPDLTQYGKWAVITGGSEGIGRGYGLALAREGFNIVLIARDMRKLQATGDEIRDLFNVEVEQISADFNEGPAIFDLIKKRLKGKEIGILVNNVGVMPTRPTMFLDNSQDFLERIINVNCRTLLLMTQTVLDDMVNRGKGVIVNVSSIAGLRPLPLMSAYSASKAFIDYFSRSLHHEYKDKGIIVQSVMPSYICPSRPNDFSELLQRPSLMCPNAETFAASAVKTIGRTHRTAGFGPHGLVRWSISQIPDFLWYPLSWKVQRELAC